MKPLSIAGLILIVAGLAALAFGHITFTTEKKIIDVGPITGADGGGTPVVLWDDVTPRLCRAD